MLRVIPEIDEGTLEKILEHIPEEPRYAMVVLFGNFDYSSVYRQVEQIFPNTKLRQDGGVKYRLENPTKKNILEIYKKSQEEQKRLDDELKRMGDMSQEEREMSSFYKGLPPRIDFVEAGWSLKDGCSIELNTIRLKVSYKSGEPAYISQLRKALGLNIIEHYTPRNNSHRIEFTTAES